MTWEGDERTSTPEWRRLRTFVLERDGYDCHVCHGEANPGPADEVDHLVSHAECIRRGLEPDDPSNLAAIHDAPCHRKKSSAEGNAEQARRRAQQRRPAEQHPGVRP